jgi:hypothetical protein
MEKNVFFFFLELDHREPTICFYYVHAAINNLYINILLTILQIIPIFELLYFRRFFISGTGFGLMYLPAIVMVGYYFDKRRALATGIAVCGSGIGSFLFAPLSEYLLSKYSWKGAMWILSGISLNGIVFSALFRPLEYADTSVELIETCDEEVEVDNKNKPIYNPLLQKIKGTPENSMYRSKSLEACNKENGGVKDSDIARLGHSLFLDAEPRSRKHAKGRHVLHPLERKDIFYSGSVQRLPEYTAAGNEENFVRSMLKLNHDLSDEADTGSVKSKKVSWLKLFTDTFDFSLLKSPTFVIYGLSCFLCMIGKFNILVCNSINQPLEHDPCPLSFRGANYQNITM